MRARIRILEPEGFSPSALARLQAVADVSAEPLGSEDLGKVLGSVDVLWLRLGHVIDAELLSGNPRCRIIATPVTGLDHIDLDACERAGVRVLSLRGEREFLEEVRATAELAIGLAIDLMRHISSAAADVKEGHWRRDRFRGHELHRKTVGLVGVGRLGSIVAGYYRAFGAKVLGYDPHAVLPEDVEAVETLGELFERSDLVSVHARYDESTHHLIHAGVFARARPHLFLVNTARGGILDEAALLDALREGRIAGVALDVLSGEPDVGADHPVLRYARQHDNLLIVPHIGGNSFESFEKTECFLAERVVERLAELGLVS